MDFGLLIVITPAWALLLATLLLSLAAAECGAVIARRRSAEPEGPVAALVGAVLGLLAFILAFTFSLAANRFDVRKQLVIDDANACATAWLRAGLLPPAQRDEIRPLLKEYIQVRAQISPTADIPALVRQAETLLGQIWQRTTALMANDEVDGEIRSLFVESVNDLFTLHETRKTVALVHRIPGTIWLSLYALSTLSMFAIGYQVGSSGASRLLAMPLLAGAFALVIVMIAEMDKPLGLFLISQQPMVDVQQLTESDGRPSP